MMVGYVSLLNGLCIGSGGGGDDQLVMVHRDHRLDQAAWRWRGQCLVNRAGRAMDVEGASRCAGNLQITATLITHAQEAGCPGAGLHAPRRGQPAVAAGGRPGRAACRLRQWSGARHRGRGHQTRGCHHHLAQRP